MRRPGRQKRKAEDYLPNMTYRIEAAGDFCRLLAARYGPECTWVEITAKLAAELTGRLVADTPKSSRKAGTRKLEFFDEFY